MMKETNYTHPNLHALYQLSFILKLSLHFRSPFLLGYRETQARTSCLSWKKERKDWSKVYDLTSLSCQQGFRVWSTHKWLREYIKKNTFARLQKPVVVVGKLFWRPPSPLQHVWKKHPQRTNMQETKAKGGFELCTQLKPTYRTPFLVAYYWTHVVTYWEICANYFIARSFIHSVWHPSLFCVILSWTLIFLPKFSFIVKLSAKSLK